MALGKKLVTEADVRRMSPGARELILTEHDLFVVRKVRVVAEEVGE